MLFVYKTYPAGPGWVGAGMKDGLNIKVALNSLTEHIFCIVPADYIFVRF